MVRMAPITGCRFFISTLFRLALLVPISSTKQALFLVCRILPRKKPLLNGFTLSPKQNKTLQFGVFFFHKFITRSNARYTHALGHVS